MISQSAVYDFLDREVDNWSWLKDLSDKKLDRMIAELEPVPYLGKSELRTHQKVGLLLGIALSDGLYFQLDMGLGKTFITVLLLNYFFSMGKIRKGLILTPTDEVADGWEEEINLRCPDLPFMVLKGSSEEKWQQYLELEEGFAIISYPALNWMVSRKQPKKKKRGQKRKPKGSELVPQLPLINKLMKGVDSVVYDEITKTGKTESITHRICRQITRRTKIRYGLAGRAFGRDTMVVWPQFLLTDYGETFGRSVEFFREVFFKKTKAVFGGKWAFDYTFNKERKKDFSKIIAHRSLLYTSDECQDLPPLVQVKKHVILPASSQDFYDRTVKELRQSKGDWQECKNAFIRLRQISSGFIGFTDDDTGEKAQLEFEENPKLELLMELIDSLRENRKFVISVDFTWSGARISQELRKVKIDHGWLRGGTKDWPEMKKRFDGDPSFRGIILQNKKGAYGLNLQSANMHLIYERPISVIDWEQLQKRLRREGQKRTVFQYDLYMKNTADESIFRFHQQGRNLYSDLVVNPDKVLRG